MVAVTTQEQLSRGLNQILLLSVWVGLILIIVSILLATLYSSFILKPIHELIIKMRRVAYGDFKAIYDKRNFLNVETEQLALNFNFMVENFRYLVQEVYEKQDLERKATLRALQAQINPYFLYNTLDNIFWGLESEGKSKTSQVILALSKMLRYGLNQNTSMTTLTKELEHIDRYFYVINYRFPNLFLLEISVDENIMDCVLPRLLLQPIVENAISHGLK